MKNSKKMLISAAILLALIIILPFLIPVQSYLQQAESIASNKLGVPVKITSGHLALLPSPRVVLESIVVGKDDDITVSKIAVIPTLSSLFSQLRTIDIHISKPIIKTTAFNFLAGLASQKTQENAALPVNLRQVKINDLELNIGTTKLPLWNVKADFLMNNLLSTAEITTVDKALIANVVKQNDDYLIDAKVKNWTLPANLPLYINDGQANMRLSGSQLAISKYQAQLYGGRVAGTAKLDWRNNWQANGQFNVQNVAMQSPSKMLSRTMYLSGDLNGSGRFTSQAKSASALLDLLKLNFQFKVNRGVLHGLDLIKVASLLIKQGQSGGTTEFDVLTGDAMMAGKQTQLRNLDIRSGLLAATGEVKIKNNKQLDGVIKVEIKRSVSLAAIPLAVTGTVDNPVVLPTKAALAGAVAGTAILGPGLGTSLGVKAGDAVDKIKDLFGGD